MKYCPFCGSDNVVKIDSNYDCKECLCHIEFDDEDHWEERHSVRYILVAQDENGYYYKWTFDDKAKADATYNEYKDKHLKARLVEVTL